jgi:hypothetical protein
MPASGRFLLDTNIVIALLAGEEAVLSNLDRAPEVFISAIVPGELFFGAAKSGRSLENIAKVERFAADRSILPCDLPVAPEYGRLRHEWPPKIRTSPRTPPGSNPGACALRERRSWELQRFVVRFFFIAALSNATSFRRRSPVLMSPAPGALPLALPCPVTAARPPAETPAARSS